MNFSRYEPQYAQGVAHVCLHTAGEKALTDPKEGQYALLMYCKCYLEHGICFVLTDDSDNVQGYILCAPNYEDHMDNMKPYLKQIKRLGILYPFMAKAELKCYQKYAHAYPAHLHIDILENCTGGGNGKALMAALLEELQRQGIPGIMIQVSAQNTRAIGFYKRTGFEVLEENQHFLVMGQKL